VRVIAGSARGRRLTGPARSRRDEPSVIRPTSDLIRGVIFDMLDAMGADYARVLDLYAGTGALGIEALSRGDGEADFVEDNAEGVGLIKRNLSSTGFGERGRVHRLPATLVAARLSGPPYTLVLSDPPYYDVDAFEAVRAVANSLLVDAATVIVVEHRRKTEPLESIGGYNLYRSRRHGDTVVSIYAQEDIP
jgi:16S rRNA (guanine(966)-N(2))-methyltransferase RsmD